METVILIAILILMAVFTVLMFIGRKDDLVNVKSRSAVAQTTVNVPAGSVVRIRHASDSLELEVSGPEIYPGPLSDASVDNSMWDRLSSKESTMDEKIRIAKSLAEKGIHVTIDGVGEFGAKSEPFVDESGQVYPDDGPVGELVPAPLAVTPSLPELQDMLIQGLRERQCPPAFARVASEEHGFQIEFDDPQMQASSVDREELRKVEAYRERIRANLAEAMNAYLQDNPAPERNPHPQPIQAPRPAPSAVKLPSYDFSKLS